MFTELLVFAFLAGTTRQPLFWVTLCRCICLSINLSMYVCPQNFCCCKPPVSCLTPGIAYLQIAYGQSAGVRTCNIFPSALCDFHWCIFPMIIYPPLWKYITDIGMWNLAAPGEKTINLFSEKLSVYLCAFRSRCGMSFEVLASVGLVSSMIHGF